MAALSDYLEQKLLDHVFNEVVFSVPTTVYVSLYTTDPTDADTGTEVSGGAYARVLVNENGGGSPAWDLAVVDGIGYLVDNGNDITFPTATASWGTVTHFGIHDASTLGNLLFHGALTVSKPVGDGDTFKFPVGDLDCRLE
jgi:hypothetical protein